MEGRPLGASSDARECVPPEKLVTARGDRNLAADRGKDSLNLVAQRNQNANSDD